MDSPELTDPAGDQSVSQGLPPAWGAGLDLRAVWYTDDAEGLHVTIQVEDLAALVAEPSAGDSDAMFLAFFRTDHQDPSEPARRDGQWMVRGDYQANRPEQWGYWLERPCKDGDDSDGCAGGDRDVIRPIPGDHDLDASTVTMTVLWEHLGTVVAGDRVEALTASTQYVYPEWPVYTADWDTDQEASAAYVYEWPAAAGPENATSSTEPVVAPTNATLQANATGPQRADADQDAPAPGVVAVALAAVATAISARRRLD